MPRSFNGYEPDAIDCDQLVRSLAEDFGVLCKLEVSYGLDKIQTIARCYRPADASPALPVVQALVSRPVKGAPSHYVAQYSALLDCWHQLDRGALAVAGVHVTRDWSGRPEVPRRRR